MTDYAKCKVAELRSMLKEMDLDDSGTKDVLIKRLKKNEASMSKKKPVSALDKLSTAELKEKLNCYKLPVSGSKPELLARYKSFVREFKALADTGLSKSEKILQAKKNIKRKECVKEREKEENNCETEEKEPIPRAKKTIKDEKSKESSEKRECSVYNDFVQKEIDRLMIYDPDLGSKTASKQAVALWGELRKQVKEETDYENLDQEERGELIMEKYREYLENMECDPDKIRENYEEFLRLQIDKLTEEGMDITIAENSSKILLNNFKKQIMISCPNINKYQLSQRVLQQLRDLLQEEKNTKIRQELIEMYKTQLQTTRPGEKINYERLAVRQLNNRYTELSDDNKNLTEFQILTFIKEELDKKSDKDDEPPETNIPENEIYEINSADLYKLLQSKDINKIFEQLNSKYTKKRENKITVRFDLDMGACIDQDSKWVLDYETKSVYAKIEHDKIVPLHDSDLLLLKMYNVYNPIPKDEESVQKITEKNRKIAGFKNKSTTKLESKAGKAPEKKSTVINEEEKDDGDDISIPNEPNREIEKKSRNRDLRPDIKISREDFLKLSELYYTAREEKQQHNIFAYLNKLGIDREIVEHVIANFNAYRDHFRSLNKPEPTKAQVLDYIRVKKELYPRGLLDDPAKRELANKAKLPIEILEHIIKNIQDLKEKFDID